MNHQKLLSNNIKRRPANFRLCNVSSYTTELLEIHADDPKVHVLFIPGNPGVVAFYKDFLEFLYEMLCGTASVTAVGHISHTKKNWENGRLFSLQDQIDHKVDFIKQELQSIELPIILIGHSIGSYIAIETLRRSQDKVIFCTALYPFLMLHLQTTWQSILAKISVSSILSALLSFIVASLGLLPKRASKVIILKSAGRSWSDTAIEAACGQLLQYHILRNVLFMTMTEFKELLVAPDWAFMKNNQDKIAFLFGVDDCWAPLQMSEEIVKQAPNVSLSIEREGHTHNFSCTEAGSVWVARHAASLIKSRISNLEQ